MELFISSLPKALVAIVVLVLGLFILRQVNPPATICDAQLELFREAQKKFLYPEPPVNGIQKSSMIKQNVETCKASNTPGACFELLEGLKKMALDIGNISEQCAAAAGGEKQLNDWLWSSMKLMIQIAWGEKPPQSYLQKNGWFDSSELSVFCALGRQSKRIFGKGDYDKWVDDLLEKRTAMPKSELLTRDQVWSLSILSTSCDLYR